MNDRSYDDNVPKQDETRESQQGSHKPWWVWLLSGVAAAFIAGAGWWLLAPAPKANDADSTALLATAPPPANPHPHDPDGTPRSN